MIFTINDGTGTRKVLYLMNWTSQTYNGNIHIRIDILQKGPKNGTFRKISLLIT